MEIPTVASQHMVLTGDKERFKEILKLRLIECGWRDQVKLICRQALKDTDDFSIDKLIKEITPKARSLVPDTIKKELLHRIKTQLLAEGKLNAYADKHIK